LVKKLEENEKNMSDLENSLTKVKIENENLLKKKDIENEIFKNEMNTKLEDSIKNKEKIENNYLEIKTELQDLKKKILTEHIMSRSKDKNEEEKTLKQLEELNHVQKILEEKVLVANKEKEEVEGKLKIQVQTTLSLQTNVEDLNSLTEKQKKDIFELEKNLTKSQNENTNLSEQIKKQNSSLESLQNQLNELKELYLKLDNDYTTEKEEHNILKEELEKKGLKSKLVDPNDTSKMGKLAIKLYNNDSSITSLDLQGQGLTDSDVSKLFKALQKNKTLKKLDLSENKINGDCIQDVCDMLLVNNTIQEYFF
jgi:chromosome segregation ATPase